MPRDQDRIENRVVDYFAELFEKVFASPFTSNMRSHRKRNKVIRAIAETADAASHSVVRLLQGEELTDAQVVVICVSDTPDVEAVLLGADGVSQGARPGAIVVDMSTISPSATRRMADRLAEKGIRMLDAPVSGGSEGAQKGTLTIMVGGDAEAVAQAMPVLSAMGKSITHVGPCGAGQLTKAVNQVIISGVYLAVAEGMALGLKAGVDMEKVVQALAGGAAGSWVLNYRAANMIQNEYPLGFRVRLHRKDLAIAMETARELGVFLPATALVEQIENGLISQGYGDEDVSAVARVIRKSSGVE